MVEAPPHPPYLFMACRRQTRQMDGARKGDLTYWTLKAAAGGHRALDSVIDPCRIHNLGVRAKGAWVMQVCIACSRAYVVAGGCYRGCARPVGNHLFNRVCAHSPATFGADGFLDRRHGSKGPTPDCAPLTAAGSWQLLLHVGRSRHDRACTATIGPGRVPVCSCSYVRWIMDCTARTSAHGFVSYYYVRACSACMPRACASPCMHAVVSRERIPRSIEYVRRQVHALHARTEDVRAYAVAMQPRTSAPR